MKICKAEIQTNAELCPQYFHLKFQVQETEFTSNPGQFVMLRGPWGYDPLLPRPFSLLNCDDGNRVMEVLYKTVGRGTQLLSTMGPGDEIQVLGPLGNGFPLEEVTSAEGKVLMVGGGFGIAPFFHAARFLAEKNVDFEVYFGGRTSGDLPWANEMEEAYPGKLHLTTNDGSTGEEGLVTAPLIRELEKDGRIQGVWGCGPHPMLKALTEIGEKYQVPCSVSLEEFMGCGIGVCLGCVTEIRHGDTCHHDRICMEGPVFEGPKVVW